MAQTLVSCYIFLLVKLEVKCVRERSLIRVVAFSSQHVVKSVMKLSLAKD